MFKSSKAVTVGHDAFLISVHFIFLIFIVHRASCGTGQRQDEGKFTAASRVWISFDLNYYNIDIDGYYFCSIISVC